MSLPSLQYRVKAGEPPRYHGGERKAKIEGIVIHCTAGDTVEGAVSWLNRTLKSGESKASYNYLIAKNGDIYRMARPGIVAYHAGASSWPSITGYWGSLNRSTIGIAFANDNGTDANPDDDPLTEDQRSSAIWLCAVFAMSYDFPTTNIRGHCEVSPGRKTDPLPRILNMDQFRAEVYSHLRLT